MKNNKYLHRFFKLETASLLMENKLFPNLKEITESFGAFIAVLDNLKIDTKRKDIDVFVVGDGQTPKTAALFACLTKWNCYSIDPDLIIKDYSIERLYLYKNKIEESYFGSKTKTAIIVYVHSHAKVSDALQSINYTSKHLINIPCCFKTDINTTPNIIYTDYGIHSPKNTVEVFLNC